MSILVTHPSPTGAVSEPSARTGAGGRSFPLIEFSPGRELSALADHMRIPFRKATCCLPCRNMPWNLPMRSYNSRD